MRRQIAFLVVLVFGYSLILGDDSTRPSTASSVAPDDTTTTIETISTETSTNVTSETSSTTTSESTSSASSSSSTPLGPATTLHPPEFPLDPQNNETTDYNTTTDGPLYNDTGSPPTSSSLNTDPKAEKRVDDGQRFDVASFVGGIILAVGVVGLGFFLFKVYQSRKGPRAEYNNI